MDGSQMQKVTALRRACGAFTALYVVFPLVMTPVMHGVTMWMATQERWRDLQCVAIMLSTLVVPIVGAIAVTVFNRALGAWYARLRHAELWLGAAVGGVIVHLVFVLSKWYHIEKAIDILKGLLG